VQGRNILGYLRTRTFYTPERKYVYTHVYSYTKMTSKHSQLMSFLILHHQQTHKPSVLYFFWTQGTGSNVPVEELDHIRG